MENDEDFFFRFEKDEKKDVEEMKEYGFHPDEQKVIFPGLKYEERTYKCRD